MICSQDLSSWDHATFLQQQLVVCKQLIKEGIYSAAKSGLESTLPQISSGVCVCLLLVSTHELVCDWSQNQVQMRRGILKEYMRHAILVEALLKNKSLLLSGCCDFLAMFPQTSSVLITRAMAYDTEER